MKTMKTDNKTRLLLYGLALLKLALPYLIQNGAWEPHRDEFLYLAEGRHMAWGYMEVPPLLSAFAWLTDLFNGSIFIIKFWPSLFGALTFLLAGRVVLSLGGRWLGLVLCFLPFVFGAWLRMQFLFQPNFLDIFFWTATVYGLVRYQQRENNRDLYVAGIAFGLGMLSKYTVVFYAAGLAGGLLLTWDKKVIANKHFYMALGCGLLIFLPNFLWQAYRGFPVVFHMKELQRNQLQYISPGNFIISQFLLQLPCIVTWVTGLVATVRTGKYRFVAWATVITIALLALGHAKDYYAQGAFPILMAFGAARIDQWAGEKRPRLAIVALITAWTLLAGYRFLTISLPFLPPTQLAEYYAHHATVKKTGALRWEDQQDHPLPQDFADMLGWKEMARKVAKAYASLDSAEKKQTFLFCDNYGEAGAVNYYGRKYGLPPAYSDNASFLYWMPGSGFDSSKNILLLVTDDEDEMQHAFIHEFQSAVCTDSIIEPLAREHGSLIILFKGPSKRFRAAFREKIEKDRLKTTAEGAMQKITPNPLDRGGNLH